MVFALAFATLGTSCVGPRVTVVHRYVLSAQPDSGFTLPDIITLDGIAFSLPEPKKHWWSDEPPTPDCTSFTLYLRRDIWREGLEMPFDFRFEARLNQDSIPSIDITYYYHLPGRGPSSKEGAQQDAYVAKLETELKKGADSVMHHLVAGSGATPLYPPARTLKIRDRHFEPWCESGAQGFPDTAEIEAQSAVKINER